jgi:Na+-translocating ferredoxin:NAD+ oxidoreductase subunit B
MIDTIIPSFYSIVTLAALAAVFGLFLSMAMRKLRVTKDPRIEKVTETLPGANCAACGMPGCSAYATRIVEEKFAVDLCPVGGSETAGKIAEIMGVEYGGGTAAVTARVHCRGGIAETSVRFEYAGPRNCAAANGVMGGFKVCGYGCLGFGDCVRSCRFDAMYMDDNGLPVIMQDKCTACGLCVKACPRLIISLVPKDNEIYVMCNNEEKAPVMKKGCSVGCIACKMCEKVCREALAEKNPGIDPAKIELAIEVTNYLARINYDRCIKCYRCVYVCPVPVIHPLARSKKFLELSGKAGKEKKNIDATPVSPGAEAK